MGFAERLDSLVVNVTSPDGKVKAKVFDRERVRLGFRSHSYEHYEKTVLEPTRPAN